MKKESLVLAVLMFVMVVASRLIPHPLNFTALIAVALFSGSYWKKPVNFLIPLVAMLSVDLYQGIYPGLVFNYLGVIASVLIAPRLMAPLATVAARGLFAAVLFFIVSNFGVWLQAGIYSPDGNGLVECYVRAIPFFRNTLLSTWFYSFVFYGAYRVVCAEGFQGFFNIGYGRQK